MNFQFYVEKLQNSENYKKFMSENEDAFPFSGFFVIEFAELKHPDNKQHFDYLIPSKKKAFSFQLENDCKLVPLEIVDAGVKEISLEHTFDLQNIHDIIRDKMIDQNFTDKIQRILLSLQNKDGNDFLVGTVFLSNFGLLKVNIDLSKMEIIDFEKKSFFDIMKITKKGDKK